MIATENDRLNPDCKYHVLIVEDDLCLKTILGRVLGTIDPNVSYTWATSAEEAQMILAEMRVSLVIADFGLVGKTTGLDLWDYCSENLPEMPFLMISGLDIQRFFKLVGQNRISPPFLSKPFRLGECRTQIHALLGGKESRYE
jgi:DNA-binding NtrC family response regulator